MIETKETPAEALARIQSTHSKNDAQAVLQFYQAGVELDDCIPRVTILTAKAWRALGKRIGKGASAQRVYGWRPAKKTDKKTGEEKDGMVPFTSLLFHESQMVELKAPAGTAPSAWQNPALVKAGTYDENGKVIGRGETDKHAQELADISHAEYKADDDNATTVTPEPTETVTPLEITIITTSEDLENYFAAIETPEIIDADYRIEPPAPRRIEAPKTNKARQLAMF